MHSRTLGTTIATTGTPAGSTKVSIYFILSVKMFSFVVDHNGVLLTVDVPRSTNVSLAEACGPVVATLAVKCDVDVDLDGCVVATFVEKCVVDVDLDGCVVVSGEI